MGQINHNQQIIKLKSISGDNVNFLTFTNDKEIVNTQAFTLNIPDIEKYILERAIIRLGSDYSYSASSNNWAFPNRPVRLIMTKEFVNNIILTANDLATIINREIKKNAQATNKFIFMGDTYIIVYFKKIDDADYVIVQPYVVSNDIIVETNE